MIYIYFEAIALHTECADLNIDVNDNIRKPIHRTPYGVRGFKLEL